MMMKFAMLCGALLIASAGASAGLGEELSEAEITARDDAFSKSMTKCVLVGSFTVDGKESEGTPKAERYEIESVTKASENLWIFMTRVKYGKLDTKLPITVPIEWAGDTPLVSLTNANLPGLGDDFSARVMFHENRYAGTWQHGAIGGHMFGRIERATGEKSQNAQ